MSARKLNQSKPIEAVTVQPRILRLRPVCHAIALTLATGAAMNAHAATNLANLGAQMSAARNAAGAAGRTNLGVSPQQALQASQPSIQNLAHAAQGIAQQIAAQQAAAAAGVNTASNVPNGFASGGLQVAPGVSFDPDTHAPTAATSNVSNPTLWINANQPTQTVNPNGTVNVNVQQTAQDAVLTWQTMNVGKQTTLNFDQSGGTQNNGANNWVVLNRIQDPSGKPSQILGNINAQGTVLVINRNGILFGAGSQVNVHSLIASSLDLLNQNDDLVQTGTDVVASNALFLNGGLQPPQTNPGSASELLGLGSNVSVASADAYQAPGDVTVATGASITTSADGTVSNGGLVLLAAPNVSNGGTITVAPTGQVVLAAGVGVSWRPVLAGSPVLLPELSGKLVVPTGPLASTDITPAGTLTNTGIIQAARGNVTLLGSSVVQDGVVGVTTSVNTPGSINISTVDEYRANTPTGTAYDPHAGIITGGVGGGDATSRAGQLIFGPGSVTTVLPDTDGETATSAPGTVFTPGSITMTAGSVWFQSGSLVEAPGSTVSVAALVPSNADDAAPTGDTAVQGRIYVDTGATIDVSGLANVELPISDILLTVPLLTANELADSPLLRDSFLNGLKDVIVDSTLSGTNPDGLQWVGSPILNLSGAVSLMPRTIDQLLTNGGTITLAGNEVMTADGSSLNLNGGYVHYDGGIVNTTRLIDAGGAIVPIGMASPFDTYVGVAGEFVENHPRWGVTKDWFDPLLNGGNFEPDFIVGGDAGTLNVYASQAMVLDGTITAEAFSGSKQVQGDDQPTGGTFALGSPVAVLLTGINANATGETGTVILQDSAPQLGDLSPGFGANTPLDMVALGTLSDTDPANVLATTVVPVDTLNHGGFANVSVTENTTGSGGIVVTAGTQLVVQPGGSIKFVSPEAGVSVQGSLIAPSGTISISAGNSGFAVPGAGIDLGPDALLSVAGQWINNDMQGAPGTVAGGSEYINGGSISLSVGISSSIAQSSSGPITDQSGSIVLEAGSVVDVSSGGELQANGQLLIQNGIPEGTAGSLSLITFSTNSTQPYGQTGVSGSPSLPANQPIASQIEMDGTIQSLGFAGGGTLTLQATGFQIGGDPTQTPAGDLYLPADFFAQQGFGQYVLNAMYDTTVAAGTTVRLTQQNLMPDLPALQHATSGADLTANGLTTGGTLDAYHRQATDLVMTGGAYVVWQDETGKHPQYGGVTGSVTVGEGASIVADAGASIGLGSPAQVTVLGSIIAPGGAITLSADSQGNGFAVTGQEGLKDIGFGGFTSASKSVWLGADAVLDVAGVALSNPLAAPVRSGLQILVPDTGKVMPGGTVTLSDDTGYVVAQAGSVIDVSGASTTFDELQANGQYAPQPVWSDAGTITLGASDGLFFDGTLRAQPGAAQAQGGKLAILPEQTPAGTALTTASPGAQALVLEQSGDLVPAGLAPGQDIVAVAGGANNEPTGVVQFAIDRLTGSGISTLVIGGVPALNAGNIPAPVPVVFVGNVNLALANAVEINTGEILALSGDPFNMLASGAIDISSGKPYTVASLLNAEATAQGSATPTPTAIGTTVTITAPYVAVIGPEINSASAAFTPIEAVADSTLNVNAAFIDLENQFQLSNFAQANFTSSGDIRLSSTNGLLNGQNALIPGQLFTPGNLTFKAADLYPSTGSTFVLDAVGSGSTPAPTTITFVANGASDVPLSAGGTLLVDATDIVQAGTVRAPSGSLIFGVGDPGDSTTKSQFDKLPLVVTDSVSLAAGSVTSVSNDGALIPYGTTVDGVEWQFNPVPNTTAAPDLAGPPAKFISVNGSSVALNPGAIIDLSGGGDLQAEEWVPGTGGTRDVLSQYTVSFAANPNGTAIPTNAGAANVYAILPGKQSPVSAYDPVFAQTAQPSKAANGTVNTTTASIGVGQAALNGAVGESVYLSGVPGLPAGYYTLLPSKYATLPGAFRVTVSTASGAVAPGASQTLPDGTVAVAGYMGNALDGSHSATPMLFDVQSGVVWQQYSQYTLTSANAFFPALAAGNGSITPQLPRDAGQLVLAATQGLTLGATLDTAAAPGGAPAEIDIASQAIQILGSGEAALPGYLQLSANQLDALDAGSLLIGGIRTQTTSGISIDAIANSVVISNDAADPLTGPEIMLVTKTDPTGTDPRAVNGLRIDGGSVVEAKGSYPSAKDVPITIGVAPDSNGAGGVSGDGAFLSVTNGGDAVVTRANTTPTGTNEGLLTVGADAVLDGGAALTLDSSGNLSFDPNASLSGTVIAVDGSAITFTDQTGAGAAKLPGFVAGPAQIAQLANAQEVILRSAGDMNFDGSAKVAFGSAVELSAGRFVSDGGAVTISAPQITLGNDLEAPDATGTAGAGTLTVNAQQIDFGNGDVTLSGFGSVAMSATWGIVAQGNGTFDAGALPVTLNAPVYLADTGSGSTVQTTGALNLNSAAGTAPALNPLGGAFTFVGGTVNVNGATIDAPAGNVSLEATSGDLTIASGSTIRSAGVALPFFDIVEYAPAGAIKLTSDTGSINVAAGSTLDFSGANGGGPAGSLALSAPEQTVNLAGTIAGAAVSGYLGGSFSLDTGGAVDLDALSSELASSGVNDAITVQTNAGNLMLSSGNTLTARTVSLTADGGLGNSSDSANGNVVIDGAINANGVQSASGGAQGGTISLYGRSGVDVEGSLQAKGSDAYLSDGKPNSNSIELGGTISIGTTGTPTPGSYSAQYGYENVAQGNSGQIVLGASAKLNVAGGGVLTFAADGLTGGVINLRAPLLDDGSVKVTINTPAGEIVGARAVNLEAYAVWSTTDTTTGVQHFDGFVDPAGWYDGNGNLVAGTFTTQTASGAATFTYTPDGTGDGGGTLTNSAGTKTTVSADQLKNGDPGIGFDGVNGDFFAPKAGAVNTNHTLFYGDQSTTNADGSVTTIPGTLMNFVEHGVQGVATAFAGSGIAGFAVVPGIELDNPSSSINGGNISVLTNWNLGTGSAPGEPLFRFDNQAPVITFRAKNNVEVDASLTDGFFQINNPSSPGVSEAVPALQTYGLYSADKAAYNTRAGAYSYTFSYYGPHGNGHYRNVISVPMNITAGDPAELEEYYALYKAYATFLDSAAPSTSVQKSGSKTGSDYLGVISKLIGSGTIQPASPEPVAPLAAEQLSDPSSYLLYLAEYRQWFDSALAKSGKIVVTAPSAPAPQVGDTVIPATTTTVSAPGVSDNTAAPVATAANPLPLLSASLESGSSSSFRLVAGANLDSANPLALQAVSSFDATTTDGEVTLDGHFSVTTATPDNLALLAPTMIRTGTGSIDIAAANNIVLLDPIAPAVIYTAGTPAPGAPQGTTTTIFAGSTLQQAPDLLISSAVNPEAAGNLSLYAQNNITGIENVVDTTGSATGVASVSLAQFWWQWMEVGNPTGTVGQTTPTKQTIQTSINFGAFDQGVMSVGGNVSVTAGGNISDLAVSLPTTWYLTNTATDTPTKTTIGGGNLAVTAGGNVLSGDYFVAAGTGTITAGGQISPDVVFDNFGVLVSVPTILATQAGTLNISARQGVNIGGVFNPSLVDNLAMATTYQQQADGQGYGANSAVNIESTTGNIGFGTLSDLSFVGDNTSNPALHLPAAINLTAFTGGITVASGGTLASSPVGELSLVADQSVNLNSQTTNTTLGMAGADLTSIDETNPVRIYSLNGSIVDGTLEPAGSGVNAGFYDHLLDISVDKPALIEAGQDIVNLAFQGQNLRDADVTRIVAGHDIDDTPLPLNPESVPNLQLGGPGYFDIEAGRNIGPLSSQLQAFDQHFTFPGNGLTAGIDAVGNANNPSLPHQSASIEVLFGVGPGIDDANFISTYIDPGSAAVGVPSATQALITFMEQYNAGQAVDTGLVADKPFVNALSAAAAWAQFQTLPPYVRQLFVEQTFFNILTDVGNDFNNPASPFFQQYARGFQAINTLFPASLGYTENNLGGGGNGANALVDTGNLDIRSSTIQTQQGGNVSIFGPGGEALVGSSSAPPSIIGTGGAVNTVVAGPGTMGILTLEKGDVDIFTDQSLLLAQSRVFTEQGGNMTIWSSNGDIDAGKGSTSVADIPPPLYVCDVNHFCTLDTKGEVTGAGIATLQTIPGSTAGNINLLAPRGTVDAGAAGIRVSGNLNIAALHVANADNIQVQGKVTGIPTVAAVDTGALTAASSAASAATQMAQNLVRNNASGVPQRHWIITVQVEGFGDSNDDSDGSRKKRKPSPLGYQQSTPIMVLGFGDLGDAQRAYLNKEEQSKLGKL